MVQGYRDTREDLLLVDSAEGEEKAERVGAFITEVVVPRWTPKQCRITDEEEVSSTSIVRYAFPAKDDSSRHYGMDIQDGRSIPDTSHRKENDKTRCRNMPC
jgi:hypothetical protein